MQVPFSLPTTFPQKYLHNHSSCRSVDDFFASNRQLHKFLKKCDKHPPDERWYRNNIEVVKRAIYLSREHFKTYLTRGDFDPAIHSKHLKAIYQAYTIALNILEFLPEQEEGLQNFLGYAQQVCNMINETSTDTVSLMIDDKPL